MKYPTLKIDGKKVKIDKRIFDWYLKRITNSITMDTRENQLGLTKKDIELLGWNCAVMVYHEHIKGEEICK